MTQTPAKPVRLPEPVWPALLALVGVGGLHLALPEPLTFGPSWLLLSVVCVLMVPIVIARLRGFFTLSHVLGYIVLWIVTSFMLWSLYLLVRSIIAHQIGPSILLRSACALWVTNILIFACWYWLLDAGGPHARNLRGNHTEGDFLFPQMTLSPRTEKPFDQGWAPGFVDYLFLAFNTSTAFSPTDTPVLSRWAKGAMMVQALISFATVALLAARAVNVL